MSRTRLFLLALVATAAAAAAPGTASGATVFRAPFQVSSEAAALITGCAGESVTWTGGDFNIVLTDTVFHRNVVSGVGTGDTTGTTYYATGHLQDVFHETRSGGYVETFAVMLQVQTRNGSMHLQAPI